MSFELLDVFLSIGIAQGIFLAFSLQRVKNTNKSTNRVLASLLILATLMLIGRLIYFRYPAGWPLQLSLLPDVIIFIFGPLSYKFVRRLCFAGEKTYKLPWVHFVPAVLQFGVFLFFLPYTGQEYVALWNAGKLLLPFSIIEGAAIVLNIYYWTKSLNLLRVFEREERNAISYSQSVRTFVKLFLFFLLLFYAIWLFSYMNTYFVGVYTGFVNYNVVWVMIPMFIYAITYYTIRQPEFFQLSLQTVSVSGQNRLDSRASNVLSAQLTAVFDEEKIYLNPDLTLRQLSDKLGSTTHDVSWLLNQVHKTSFYDFVNRYRVEEFIRRIENGEHEKLTILAIAYEVGFKSKSTFNKVFKTIMRDTPSNYLNKIKSD